jgi:hypothetical protein
VTAIQSSVAVRALTVGAEGRVALTDTSTVTGVAARKLVLSPIEATS